jgi:uncharacterized OsmC-like protein
VEGTNELVAGVVVLTKIHVNYRIRLPEGAPDDKVSRALDTHVAKCPTAQSLKDSVEISWSADITRAGE